MYQHLLARLALPLLACGLASCVGLIHQQAGLERGPDHVRRSHVQVPMPDGVALAADLYLPHGEGPWPVIMVRTPYDKRNHMQLTPTLARMFAQHGYGVVVQDVRGRFQSEGDWQPFAHEQQDGATTLDWLTAQPWCDGRVGTFGLSYYGFTQWALGVQAPTALKTMVPLITSTAPYTWMYTGGAYRTELGSSWALTIADQDRNRPKNAEELESIFTHLPPSQADEATLRTLPYYDEWVAADRPGQPYDGWLPADGAAKVQVPTLLIGGWFDIFLDQALQDFQSLRADAQNPASGSQLIIGPWGHTLGFVDIADVELGEEADFAPVLAMVVEWLDLHLKGQGGTTAWGPVRTFQVGSNTWHDWPSWPPPEATAQSLLLTAAGGLADTGSDTGSSNLSFVYDPNDPVPTLGGNNIVASLAGPRDQRALDDRTDILRFNGAPLSQDLHLTGPITADLCVSTSASDTAFTAKLLDVSPEGLAINVVDSIRLLSRRAGDGEPLPVEPGTVYSLSIQLGQTHWTVAAGHHLRLDISSSNFPRFARHPNQTGAWAEIQALVPATQALHLGGECDNRLVLTTL